MIPVPGQRVGPYEVLGRLGSGGMGIVFSAWDSRLHRDVAIKLLRDEYLHDDSRERFLMEARAASGLNHPNICTIFDIGEQDGDPYLVMELLKGETLRARITAGRLPAADILSIAIEIADALTAAHSRGIIHRDIKPANIFLVDKPSGGRQAKVLDFGLAQIDLGDGLGPRFDLTGHGLTVGTVAYMSPEQARGEVLDARSDLFGLGIVMYEMATGSLPFHGATSALVYMNLLERMPEPVRTLNQEIPEDLERIILKLLAKDCAERFQSAAELLNALRRVVLEEKPNVAAMEPPGRDTSSSSSGKISVEKPRVESDTFLRPARRESLPPSTFPISGKHWTRPSRTTNITAGADSSRKRALTTAEDDPLFSFEDSTTHLRVAPLPSEEPGEANLDEEALPAKHGRNFHWLLWATVGLAVLIIAAILYWRGRSHAHPTALTTLMLASVANHSGDKTLDGVVLEGLRLDLAQSPHLSVPDSATVSASAQAKGFSIAEPESVGDARRVATAVGASCFLFGEIRSGVGFYTISVKVYNVATGAPIVQEEDTAASREQIADAIDRLSVQIRSGLGESDDIVARTSVPLTREATSNVEALQAYLTGDNADAAGHSRDALAAFQHAVTLEPKFAQAWIRLAWIYRGERAELAAVDAATHARDTSAEGSDRTKLLAAVSYDVNALGDYSHALTLLDQLAKNYPRDLSIAWQRALLLRWQGKFSEALEAAQGALARNPYDFDASAQAEYAMLALDRGEAAVGMESRRGQRHAELRILLRFLNDARGGAPASLQDAGPERQGDEEVRAQVLDATGQLTEGLAAWRAGANTARATPALVSAAAYFLAQAAVDRALVFDCATAGKLVGEASSLPRGQRALFAIGMANGLCGNLDGSRAAVAALTVQYPQSFPVRKFYLAELSAVAEIQASDPDVALSALQSAQPYDRISLSPYLRGLAHVATKQWPEAIADFQFVLLHRGAMTLTNAPVVAMSQLGLARAYAASGDKENSAAAYKAFLEMWKAADEDNPLLAEARLHSK